LAGATVVAGDAGAGFCCAVATATKATNVGNQVLTNSAEMCRFVLVINNSCRLYLNKRLRA
jgi:hypothetical protein